MDTHLFQQLTGHPSFPWQERLYREWSQHGVDFCSTLSLPTGAGKTSVIALWLMLLLAERGPAGGVPRKLVYVVNRRTVVDQTTEEVEKLVHNLKGTAIEDRLRKMCVIGLNKDECSLAVSTLRGQLADNRAWSADPCRPAVVVGTVDMIGSRLLFGGYGVGFKLRPLHAAFLTQDTLLIHDEAHLEPAFQQLLEGIGREQAADAKAPVRGLSVVALSATARGVKAAPFILDDSDRQNDVLGQRLHAHKRLSFYTCDDKAKELGVKLAELALQHEDSGQPILIFARGLETIQKIYDELTKGKENKDRAARIAMLTGTIRGHERDQLVKNPVFQRFLPRAESKAEGTVYLLCTSAGEVGVNLSAKHLVCDLSTYDSMAQRFGRVNRFGDETELPADQQTRIDIVHPESFKDGNPVEEARKNTLAILKSLPEKNASPAALGALDPSKLQAAFSPEPKVLALTDILLDNWTLTSIREKLPGRPTVAPYLHGVEEWNPPRTTVAWRAEVELVTEEHVKDLGSLLEAYPLKPQEILSDRSDRVYDQLSKLAKRLDKDAEKAKAKAESEEVDTNEERQSKKQLPNAASTPIWLIDEQGTVKVENLAELVNGDKKRVLDDIAEKTLLLPPCIGGLDTTGMFDGGEVAPKESLDVCELLKAPDGNPLRKRTFDPLQGEEVKGWKCVQRIDLRLDKESAPDEGESAEKHVWCWYVRKNSFDSENTTASTHAEVLVADHNQSVGTFAEAFARKLGLPGELVQALKLAGSWHDLGKARDQWQRSIGNPEPEKHLAKSTPRMKPVHLSEYRHEFGSLLELDAQPAFASLSDDMQDLVRHLIAAHHGRARPHFTSAEATDPEASLSRARAANAQVPHRFARMQARYGRWGLAYLESILRAADYAASAERELQR